MGQAQRAANWACNLRGGCSGRQLAFVFGRRAALKVLASPESTLVYSMPSGGRSFVMKWSVPPYRLRWVIRWSPDLQHRFDLLCNQSWESGEEAGQQHGMQACICPCTKLRTRKRQPEGCTLIDGSTEGRSDMYSFSLTGYATGHRKQQPQTAETLFSLRDYLSTVNRLVLMAAIPLPVTTAACRGQVRLLSRWQQTVC